MEYLQSLHPAFLAAAAALFGLVVGSFLNVVILRYPLRLLHEWRCQCRELLADQSGNGGNGEAATAAPAPSASGEEPPGLVMTRSHCPSCRHTIAWYDNIPVLSWLMLRGKCRHCGARISLRYAVVEIATALLTVAVIAHFGPTPAGLAGVVFTWFLIAGTGIDMDHKLLPDQITLPLMWLGLILNAGWGLFTDLPSAVWGSVAGYLALWTVFQVFRLLTGKEGMGYGDFKLLAAIGAWFGWQVLPLVILLASAVGALVGIALIAARHMGREVPIAFGPFLAAAGWIAMLWGEELMVMWLP